jgi:hypothetical protein
METFDARALAKALMAEHGLVEQGWSLTLDINAGRLYGQCRWRDKRIRLNPDFVRRNGLANVRDLILHEIAHALVGPGHGHDKAFYAMCRRIGARPERCHTMPHVRPSRRRARRSVVTGQAPTTDGWLRSAPARIATARRKLREARAAYAEALLRAVRDIRGAQQAEKSVCAALRAAGLAVQQYHADDRWIVWFDEKEHWPSGWAAVARHVFEAAASRPIRKPVELPHRLRVEVPSVEGAVRINLITDATPSIGYSRSKARFASAELSRLIREVEELRRRRPSGVAA